MQTRSIWGSGYFSKGNYLRRVILRRNWLSMLLFSSFQFTLLASVLAGTVTIHVAYDSAPKQTKAPENSKVVIWLTPLSSSIMSQAESALNDLPHHFQLLQTHKHFEPHLLVIPVGSIVDFPNKDPFFHNVFSLFDGKRFDLGLYEAGGTRAIKFDRVGVSFLFCNIHPQMSGVVLTVNTPYYGISNAMGVVEISGVPQGKYRMEIWSERALPETLRKLEREIPVTGKTESLGFLVIKESEDILVGHKNKYGSDYPNTAPSTPGYRQPE
jgi:plastocyanin